MQVFKEKRYALLVLIVLIFITNSSSALLFYTLYVQNYKKEKTIIKEIADAQVSLIEAIVQFEIKYPHVEIIGKTSKEIELMKVSAGMNTIFSKETQYNLAKMHEGRIVFLAISENNNEKKIDFTTKNKEIIIEKDSRNAEPMRQALSGHNGQMVGLDHNGKKVLASYKYIPELEVGLVVKRYISDMSAPYINAVLLGFVLSTVIIFMVYFILNRLSLPFFTYLSSNERKLKVALQSAKICVWEYSILTKKEEWSPEMYLLFDGSREEFPDIVELFKLRVHPADKKRVAEAVGKTLNFFYKLDIEYRIIKKDKTIHHIKMFANIETQRNIREGYIVGTCMDVTEKVEQMSMLLQQSKLAAMGEMIGAIAHQWRQPLNAVGVLSQELEIRHKSGVLSDAEITNIVEQIQDYLEYMSKTIDDFRNFFKPSKEKMLFSCTKAIENILSMVGSQLDIHSIKVDIQEDSRDESGLRFTYFGFESEFKQVIINIINNAKEAMEVFYKDDNKSKKLILIRLYNDEKNIKITIRNNGSQIMPHIIDTLFEPYVSTKLELQGTGLGLYMAKTIIERSMNGHINVKNIDDGVEFTIVFPIELGS